MINHVVVGYCVAIGRDEKSRALAGDLVMAVKFMLLAEPVLLEKPFHRRTWFDVAISALALVLFVRGRTLRLINLDSDRDDGRFYFGD